MFAGAESLIRPPAPAISINFRPSPCSHFTYVKNRSVPFGIAARIGGDGSSETSNSDSDSLLRAATCAASLRFQETQRPDPLFIDPYAGGLLSPGIDQQDVEGNSSSALHRLSPLHYRLATKFIDDRLASLLASNDDLRQMDKEDNWIENIFMNQGLRLSVTKYNEVAKSLKLDGPSEDVESFLFIAEQLHFSDAQMELWRMHFDRIEDEGDEDGFEEL